ncbi:MAG: hypothetical protein JXQ75_14935 [Phycisphaerae bacterium]|nr:hypothetical protein [Phycisphaerae bacterium]
MRHKTTNRITLLIGGLVFTPWAVAQSPPAPFVDGIPAPPTTVPQLQLAARSLGLPDAFTAENTEVLPAVTEMFDPTAQNPPVIGRVYEIDLRASLRGSWTSLEGGGQLWTMAVYSPNSPSLRLRFEPFRLPEGCELVIYNADEPQEIHGPFTGSARTNLPLWVPTIFGNEVRVELYVPARIELGAWVEEVNISGVAQDFLPGPVGERGCRIDVTCDAAWANEALGVAYMRFVSGGLTYTCTGSIINRMNADYAPLFLTAGHCISTEAEANTLEAYWFYQTSTCNGVAPAWNTRPVTNGSTLLATHSTADNTVLGLTGTYPGGLYWNGWDSGAIPNPTDGVLIHHPSSDRKSISYGVYEGRDDGQCTAPIDLNYRLDLSDGGQEHGSSGGPGFDPAHRIRTVASCSDDPGCDPGEDTWEGSFPNAYSTLSPFLDPQLNVWVDGGYAGTERGTEAQPWDTIIEGYFGVRGGGTIHILADNYPAVTLRGLRSMTLTAEGGSVIIGR